MKLCEFQTRTPARSTSTLLAWRLGKLSRRQVDLAGWGLPKITCEIGSNPRMCLPSSCQTKFLDPTTAGSKRRWRVKPAGSTGGRPAVRGASQSTASSGGGASPMRASACSSASESSDVSSSALSAAMNASTERRGCCAGSSGARPSPGIAVCWIRCWMESRALGFCRAAGARQAVNKEYSLCLIVVEARLCVLDEDGEQGGRMLQGCREEPGCQAASSFLHARACHPIFIRSRAQPFSLSCSKRAQEGWVGREM